MRRQINRVVLFVALLLALPAIAVAERRRPGAGRGVAHRAITVVAYVIGVRFDIDGDPAVGPGPYVLVPNHRSPLDIPAMLLARPGARFLAAAELFRIPLLGRACRALDCIPVDRRNPQRTHVAIDHLTLRDGRDLVVFAEGGIRHQHVGPFKTGAFRIAVNASVPVVPVSITRSDDLLGAGARLRVAPGCITVRLGTPIPTDNMTLNDVGRLRDRVRTAVVAGIAA